MKALAGYAIIEPFKEEEKTTSGIVIATVQKDRPVKGKILDLGPEYLHASGKYVSPSVKVGDVVYYRKWSGDEIKEGEKEYRIVKFEDIIAIA